MRPTGTTETEFTPGVEPGQVLHGAHELRPALMPGQETIWQFMIIPPRQTAHVLNARAAVPVTQHPGAQVRVGGVDRDVDGEMRRSIIRCSSRCDRFVKVI